MADDTDDEPGPDYDLMPPLPDPCRMTKPAPGYLLSELLEWDCSLETNHPGDHEDETRGHTWPREAWERP